MNKAVFLDRDGTINVDRNYLYRIEDFTFLPGVVDALRLLQNAGYLLIVITNQSGIARGYYSEADYRKLTAHMRSTLAAQGVVLTDVLHCPHLTDAAVKRFRVDCDCRKPKTGLFYRAAKKWDVDFGQSWAVGDRARDCSICWETNCRGILVGGPSHDPETADGLFYVADLQAAAELILSFQIDTSRES